MADARAPSLPGIPVAPSVRGRQRQATGAAAERVVEAAHRACVLAGLASPLLRLDSGIRVGPGGRAVSRGSAALDYSATLKGGRSLVLECKSIDDRLRLRQVSEAQAEALSQADFMGALALVMAVGPRDIFALEWGWSRCPCPLWNAWHSWRNAGTGASLSLDDLARWRVAPGTHYLARWLDG